MNYDQITDEIVSKSIKVHRKLGPGLLESAYQECLFYELKKSGLRVSKEIPIPIIYDEVKLDHGYRVDIVVENKIALELKTVEQLNEVHQAQILTYMKLGDFQIGYLLNFNVKLLKNGIKRFRI